MYSLLDLQVFYISLCHFVTIPHPHGAYSTGTGKSVLLREIISYLGGSASLSVGITASTGIASTNIGGTTIHSWAGIGLGHGTAKNLAGKIVGQPSLVNVLDRWRTVKTLIIDESV